MESPKLNQTTTCQAPAKINLRLKVMERLSNGYHRLSMLNSCIALADVLEIRIEMGNEVRIETTGPFASQVGEVGEDPFKNLASRAAIAFFEEFELTYGLYIKIIKNVPVGAGLGGGSADAAAVLRFLSEEFKVGVCQRSNIEERDFSVRLERLALQIGADVPFLLSGGVATVGGIGEDVKRLEVPFLAGLPCWLILPGVHSSTPEVFRSLKFIGETSRSGERIDPDLLAWTRLVSSPDNDRFSALLKLLSNDLSASVVLQHPEIGDILSDLNCLSLGNAIITGSGSTVVVLPKQLNIKEKELEAEIRNALSKQKIQIVPTRLLANFV